MTKIISGNKILMMKEPNRLYFKKVFYPSIWGYIQLYFQFYRGQDIAKTLFIVVGNNSK